MPHIAFRNWLNQEANQLFWKQPLPSEKMDDIIIDPVIQKSIAGSNKNQMLYSYIENFIVTSYARLIDHKLREIYQCLSLREFRDPSGFEQRRKSSDAQLTYFELRAQFEFFLKNDIQQHRANPDAELNAFRRWVEISNVLLKRHCYEGFLLVFTNLQVMTRPDLINGLPQCVRKNYNQLCEMNKPVGNHKALRQYMIAHQSEADFSPLLFTCHDITMINEYIDNLRGHEFELWNQNRQLNAEINKVKKSTSNQEELAIKIQYLQTQREGIIEELKKVRRILVEQFQQRKELLGKVQKEQKQPLTSLPSYIEQTYNRIKIRFNKQKSDNEDVLNSSSSGKLNASPPTLYSNKLLPSLWKRKGVPENNYWEHMFTPNCLKNK